MDRLDRHLLDLLQRDVSLSLEAVGEAVGLSRNACWRRLRRLEEAGFITGRVALLDPQRVNLGLTVFVAVRTSQHNAAWAEAFKRATDAMPEIQGVYRTSGELDYLIKARVPDVAAYDALYQRLIQKVDLADVSASFVMEELKESTVLPLSYA
ncbi:MAG: Lrp/AsnC family transcriptional regulator [Rhodospirillales bacterium]